MRIISNTSSVFTQIFPDPSHSSKYTTRYTGSGGRLEKTQRIIESQNPCSISPQANLSLTNPQTSTPVVARLINASPSKKPKPKKSSGTDPSST